MGNRFSKENDDSGGGGGNVNDDEPGGNQGQLYKAKSFYEFFASVNINVFTL